MAHMSTMHGNDPQVLELEKARNLAKKQYITSAPHKHAPGWNESLASESEAHVKADQGTLKIDELVTTTIDYVARRHPPQDNSGHAQFEREEIMGPLGAAQGETIVRETHREIKPAKANKTDEPAEQVEGPLKTAKSKHHGHKKSKPTASEEAVRADRY